MKIDHVALWVDDLEQMRTFYMHYFSLNCGERYINPSKNYSSYFLSYGKDKTRIELMHVAGMAKIPEKRGFMKGMAHLAISVGGKEQVDTLTDKLRADRYKIASEPRTTGDGYYESAILDPEGNYIEICE